MAQYPVWQATITDEAGNARSDATVRVQTYAAGSPLAVLYADREGTDPLGNPVNVDDEGFVRFYVAAGVHKITAESGADVRVWEHVAIGSVDAQVKTKRIHTEAGTVTVTADDVDQIFIDKTIAAATTVQLPSAADRAASVRIIDGKGDAGTNNITIIPASGEKIYGTVDYSAVIDGNGGSVELEPRPDGSGWN